MTNSSDERLGQDTELPPIGNEQQTAEAASLPGSMGVSDAPCCCEVDSQGQTPNSSADVANGSTVNLPAQETPPVAESPTEVEPSVTSEVPAPPSNQILPGTLLKCRVTRVSAEEVFVDLVDIDKLPGVNLGEQELRGTIPIIEFLGQPMPRVQDELSVVVERHEPETGLLVLSKRQADERTFWDAVQPGDVLEGVVTGMNKGGLDIDLGGAKAFLPASQVDVRKLRDISTLIGQHIGCVVTDVDRATHDLIVSRRKFIEKQRQDERAEFIKTLKEGETRTGTVTSLTDYGAFIDIGGVNGLLHITDMTWGRITHPSEMFQDGQQVTVLVTKVNLETNKVSLGLKQLKPNPWDNIEEKYKADQRVQARVLRFTDFGAFVELEEGVEALLPISEMSWGRRPNHPSEVLNIGDTIEVAVLKAEAARKRISVGLKQTSENPWAHVNENFPLNSENKGKVLRLVDFGAFVELAPGVEGLVHISELSNQRVRSPGDVVKEGQEVQVRVIKLDMENQRISLSMRPAPKIQPRQLGEGRPDTGRDRKKREKPLRGGLSSHFEW